VNSVPAERVAQIHIAGHSKFTKYILDTHDHPVIDPVWKLYARAIERVAQIHIAGHSKYEKYILDTHDHPVIDPVWGLYARAIELIGPTATLLEWDDHIPSFDEVHREALKATRYVRRKVVA